MSPKIDSACSGQNHAENNLQAPNLPISHAETVPSTFLLSQLERVDK